MDIGCFDLCSISVESNEKSSLDFDSKLNDVADPLSTSSKIRKIKNSKEAVQSTLSTSLNKLTSQIKKPPHRKTSPVNWFPRKKGDSYLERKIKMLQEISGMNSTLDETLGDSNPHYCRVLREKMAAKEAAFRVLEARKAALVEASWCRILKAARIQNKEAEAQLLQASKTATEAFEAATAKGVIMYDTPNCPKKLGQIHTSSIGGTYAVTASFETAFEVDKEVAAAVKTALTKLANCPSSFSKDEIKELLRKISQNPDTDQNNEELSEFLSETGSSDLETVSQKDGFIIASQDLKCKKIPVLDTKLRENRRRKSLEKLNMTKIVDMMLVRLQSLQEDELSSIATTVATCGLNAALAQVESNKLHQPAPNFSRRISSWGAGRKNTNTELPSLDKFLVKHMTKLEREVQEAKNSRKNEPKEETNEEKENSEEEISKMEKKNQKGRNSSLSESFIDLGSMFVKHSSKLEKEIEDAKMKNVKGLDGVTNQQVIHFKEDDVKGLPSLDKFLVKHVSKLEKEVQEAKNKTKNVGNTQQSKRAEDNDASSDTLEKILVKPVHRLQREKMQASANEYQYKNIQRKKQGGTTECESLDKVLVKHVSRLEKEKMRKLGSKEEEEWKEIIQRKKQGGESVTTECESLDKVLVKHVSRLEKEKMRKLGSKEEEEWKGIIQRKKQGGESVTTECESLDKVLVKHVSRLEKEKMRKLGSKEEEEWKGIIQRKKQGGESVITECESLDKVLVKHVSRLEKEKMRKLGSKEEEEWKEIKRYKENKNLQMEQVGGGLEQILVKHKSKLEKEKMDANQELNEETKASISRKEARERELQETWGGLGLGNSTRPHVSKLEKDKAAWIKAEKEGKQGSSRAACD